MNNTIRSSIRVHRGAVWPWLLAPLITLTSTGFGALGNRLENPSFEEGMEPWFSLASPERPAWQPFTLSTDPAQAQATCVRLELRTKEITRDVSVWGAIQDRNDIATLPRFLRGRYYVEAWERGSPKQYIQVVLSLTTGQEHLGVLSELRKDKVPIQIAWVLAGIREKPFAIRNRRFIFSGPGEPELGRWINFEFDLHEAFENEWRTVPQDILKLRLLCEARFDERASSDPEGRAVVYFDDLYLGDEPASSGPDAAPLTAAEEPTQTSESGSRDSAG